MAIVKIALKANQATTFPVLLVARFAKELNTNASINVDFKEVEALESGGKAAVKLAIRSGTSSHGTENVINGLVENYPYLQGNNEKLVSQDISCRKSIGHSRFPRSKSG